MELYREAGFVDLSQTVNSLIHYKFFGIHLYDSCTGSYEPSIFLKRSQCFLFSLQKPHHSAIQV